MRRARSRTPGCSSSRPGRTRHPGVPVPNDSYRFFDRIGMLLKTGPTSTNVCDLQLVLVW